MIELMKFDMGGAGATLGAARILAAVQVWHAATHTHAGTQGPVTTRIHSNQRGRHAQTQRRQPRDWKCAARQEPDEPEDAVPQAPRMLYLHMCIVRPSPRTWRCTSHRHCTSSPKHMLDSNVLTSLLSLPPQPADVEVHFLVAACENMVAGEGLRPGDILTAANGALGSWR
jgi:hypothetical protein